MSHREQAAYVGVQGVFWNLGRIIATGLLVSLTGILHGRLGLDWIHSWMVVMAALAAVMGLSWLWHLKVLPSGGAAAYAPAGLADAMRTFKSAFTTFFAKKMIWRMIAVAYFYRFGEGLIEKIGPLFLLDRRAAGRARARQRPAGNDQRDLRHGGLHRGCAAGRPLLRAQGACAPPSSSSCSP